MYPFWPPPFGFTVSNNLDASFANYPLVRLPTLAPPLRRCVTSTAIPSTPVKFCSAFSALRDLVQRASDSVVCAMWAKSW